jgi:hypothetical protein
MKPIDQMNAGELAEHYAELPMAEYQGAQYERDQVYNRLRAIHDQHRWIPVSERMPTEGDFGIDKRFRAWLGGIDSTAIFTDGKLYVWDDEAYNSGWTEYDPNNNRVAFTHWQRITPPEDK